MNPQQSTEQENIDESFRVRPRFRVESSYTVKEIEQRLKSALEDKQASCQGRIIEGHATLYLPPEEQHYWSPQVSISFEEHNSGSLIRGLYGPRPQIWTMFVLFYSIIG